MSIEQLSLRILQDAKKENLVPTSLIERYNVSSDLVIAVLNSLIQSEQLRLTSDNKLQITDKGVKLVNLQNVPKIGDTYYFIYYDFPKIRHTTWNNSLIDKLRWAFGNCFQTNEEAEKKIKEIIDKIKIFDK